MSQCRAIVGQARGTLDCEGDGRVGFVRFQVGKKEERPQLIKLTPRQWAHVIESKLFDVNKLHLSTVLRAIIFGMYRLV